MWDHETSFFTNKLQQQYYYAAYQYYLAIPVEIHTPLVVDESLTSHRGSVDCKCDNQFRSSYIYDMIKQNELKVANSEQKMQKKTGKEKKLFVFYFFNLLLIAHISGITDFIFSANCSSVSNKEKNKMKLKIRYASHQIHCT